MSENNEERPTAAFILSLIGGIIILLVGIAIAALTAFVALVGYAVFGGMMPSLPGFLPGFKEAIMGTTVSTIIFGMLGFIFGIITIIGATMINSGIPSKVRKGSIIVLIFSILALIATVFTAALGFILALIGSILGLTWKPTKVRRLPPPPPL